MLKSDAKNSLSEIKIELTYQCDLKCIHCSSEGSPELLEKISFNKAKDIVRSAVDLGVRQISLSGGEPFIWDDLKELIDFISQYQIKQNIYSNGISDNFKTIINNIPKDNIAFIFSLHGARETTHDSITNSIGSFERSIDSIKLSKKLGFKTEIHFVPMRTNYQEIENLIKLLKEININKISLLRFVPQGRGAINRDLDLNKKQYYQLKESILKLKNNSFEIRTGSPLNFLTINEQTVCTSGINKLIIAPDLSIYPCDAFKQVSSEKLLGEDKYSSLKKYSLKECWLKSKYLNYVREILKRDYQEPCKSCKYLDKCQSGCLAQKFLYYNDVSMSQDPLCLICNNALKKGEIDDNNKI